MYQYKYQMQISRLKAKLRESEIFIAENQHQICFEFVQYSTQQSNIDRSVEIHGLLNFIFSCQYILYLQGKSVQLAKNSSFQKSKWGNAWENLKCHLADPVHPIFVVSAGQFLSDLYHHSFHVKQTSKLQWNEIANTKLV